MNETFVENERTFKNKPLIIFTLRSSSGSFGLSDGRFERMRGSSGHLWFYLTTEGFWVASLLVPQFEARTISSTVLSDSSSQSLVLFTVKKPCFKKTEFGTGRGCIFVFFRLYNVACYHWVTSHVTFCIFVTWKGPYWLQREISRDHRFIGCLFVLRCDCLSHSIYNGNQVAHIVLNCIFILLLLKSLSFLSNIWIRPEFFITDQRPHTKSSKII